MSPHDKRRLILIVYVAAITATFVVVAFILLLPKEF